MIAVYAPFSFSSSRHHLSRWLLLILVAVTTTTGVLAKAAPPHESRNASLDRRVSAAWGTPPEIFLRPGSGKRVDLVYRGLKNLLPTRLNIPDPGSVEAVYVEIVYKGKLPTTSLHKAVQAKLSTGELVTLSPTLIRGSWGADGVAIFSAQVSKTAHVQLDFEVEEGSAQSMLLYVLRSDPENQTYQSGVYASVFGYADTKSFSIPVERDTRTRDITITIPVSEITTDGRVLDFVITAGGRQTAFRRQWNAGYAFDNECCIDSIQATLRNVTGDFTKIDIKVISPGASANPKGQSYVISGLLQATVSPVCAPLNICLPEDICTDNTVVFHSQSPGPGYTATWDFGEGAHPRTTEGFGDVFLMFEHAGTQPVTVTVKGPDCISTEKHTLTVKQCGVSKCALQKATVIQHPAYGNKDGVIELDLCVSCGSTPPYRAYYTYRGKQIEVGPINQAKPRITGLEAGTYEKLYVVDVNGCQTNVTGPVTLCNGGCGPVVTCPDQVCTLTGFNEQGRKRVFWLPNLGLGDVRWRWEEGTGDFVVTGANTAEIRGRAVSISDPNCGFEIKLVLRNRRNWSQWSALGREWKGSRSRLTANQHLDWDYYELVQDVSTFKGFGCFSGTLKLSPRPADYKYGVQVGDGANDQNLSPGISLWFAYAGLLNGKMTTGEGDLNAEGTCRLQDLTRNAVPIISCAPDFTVACGADPESAPKPSINCGDAKLYKLTYVDRDLGGKPRKIERTWTAAGPGGPATCRQTLTFGDDGPPVFTKVPSGGEMSCESVQAQTAEATDGCGSVKLELRETKFNETCPGNYELRRLWTATDESGNTATAEVIVRVIDKTGPVFIAPPADVIVECKDPLPTDHPATSDACGGSVSVVYEVTACQTALPIYTWTSGELVYLTEGIDPQLTYATGMQGLTLTSMCSDQPDVRKRWRVNNPNNYPVYIRRVEAYNKTVYKGVTIPAKSEVYFFTNNETGANTTKIYWANAAGQEQQVTKAAGNDRCASLSAAETCTCVIKRRWTAKDACGNTSVYEQKIWQRDTKAPTLRNIPADVTVASAQAVPAVGNVTATDACTQAVVSVSETRVPASEYDCDGAAIHFLGGYQSAGLPLLTLNGQFYRIGEQALAFQERCGGTATITGTVVDVRNPEARFEVTLSLKTRRTYAEHQAAGGTANTACTQAQKKDWRFYQLDGALSRLSGAGANAGITLKLNSPSNSWIQLGAGANTTNCKLGVFGDLSYTATSGSFSGTTGSLQAAYVSVELPKSGACAAGFTLVRVYSATDDCGNRTLERQTVRVTDQTPPTLVGLPNNLSLSCADVLPKANVTATDEGGEATVTLDEQRTGNDCSATITRTWTAKDACGNSATGRQVITVTDKTGPTITFNNPLIQARNSGDLLVVGCSNVPTIDESIASLKDDCDPSPTVKFVDQRLDAGDCATKGYSQRFKCTWTATDRCGNTTVFFLFVEFHDDEKPVFAQVPPAVTLGCQESLPTSQPVATDNCSAKPKVVETTQRVNGSCANGYQIVRLWTASDACGNTATASQVVTYVDNQAPVFAAVPTAVSLSCQQSLPTSEPTVKDACDANVRVVLTEARTLANCAGNYTLVRLWTATDNCGNTATASQLVTVADKVAPTITFTNPLLKDFRDGQELVVDCGALPTFGKGDVVASDACDKAPSVTYSQSETVVGSCAKDGFVARVTATWSATDDCGNSTQISVVLKVRDTGKPILASVPSAVTISCEQALPNAQPKISDACTPADKLVIKETSERLDGSCAESYRIIRRWSVTDACGNTATASQTITVIDQQRPVLASIPESVTLSCEESLPTVKPTATDNCDTDVVVTVQDTRTAGSCTAGYSLVRIFTATDNCGNTATASQVITVRDLLAPTFAQIPEAVTITCSAKLPTDQPVASDNCGATPKITEISTRRAGSCPDNYEVVRTWTATDACGNAATASQIITVRDTELPVFGPLPQNLTLACDQALPTDKPRATDNCDTEVNVSVTQTTSPGTCANSAQVVRIFTATDNCGNAVMASQVITVIDQTKPVFSSVPVNVTIGCTATLPKNQPSATDNCDGQVAVTEVQERRPGSCPGAYEIVRVFSATDRCGNVATASQIVSVIDAVAPVFAYVPADVAQSCAESLPTEQPQVSDDCDPKVRITETQERRAETCPGTYEIVRHFTAIDHCGNSATASQVLRIFDDKAPVFAAVPADLTLSCADALPTTAPTASDNCDAKPAITLVESRENGSCTDGHRVIRVWTATDACGNAATARQVVTVKDTQAPILTAVPAAISISCNQSLPVDKPLASDNCDQDVSIAETQRREPGACADGYRVIRVWTATDNCGNTATASQVLTVIDREAPVFADVPAEITISCNQALPSVGPKVSDNCDTEVALNETQTVVPGACPEAYSIIRNWTATDNCGNVSTASQLVRVEDKQSPIFAFVPPGVTISCDAAFPNTQPEVNDNCDQNVTLTEAKTEAPGNCAGNYTVTRIWTATDNCGNTTTASQQVSVEDRIAPVFANVPQTTILSCASPLPTTQPLVSDNCDRAPKVVETQETIPGDCPGRYTVIRHWTATDACGNSAKSSQQLSVIDDLAPVFTEVPKAVSLNCTDAVPTVLAKASDNCDQDVSISVSEIRTPGTCAGAFTVTRIFTATDDCGNTATASQIVNFEDRVAPVFAAVPTAVTIQCNTPLPKDGPTAIDNCSTKVALVESQRTEAGTCADSYRVVRLWTATDECGNTATATQVVSVEDTQAPTFVKTPAEITIACSDARPTELATATDNCDSDVKVTVAERREDGACADSYTMIRVFTATDNCGNSATASQRVNVRDTQAPTFASVPAAVTIACSAPVPTTAAKATDNCDTQVNITEKTERRDGDCADGYTLVRIFTAVDNCGNIATASQLITVRDTKAPAFAGVPASVSLSCADPLPTTAPTATDDCDTQVNVVETQRSEPGRCANAFTIIRIWTATDNCGNTATATQRVERTDKTAPSFQAIPSQVTIACEQPLPTDLPVATDNCDPAPRVTESQRTEAGNCAGNYRVIRTFTATDACGNTTSASQTVQVEDHQTPVFAGVPAGLEISCEAKLPTDAPTASDNCDPKVKVVETQDFLRSGCAGNYRVIRTWTATDACGNTATATQLVTVRDQIAPVFAAVPAAITIVCGDALPVSLPTATDNCDASPHIAETQQRLPGGCADSYTLIRTFTATDACGNRATASQTVTVNDTSAPILSKVPVETILACEEELPADQPIATDGCDTEVVITEARTIEAGPCPSAYVLIRVWTATDNCGNTATASQRVEVGDRSEPTFTSVPSDVTVWCGESIPTDQPTAVDNCDGNPSIEEGSTRETGACADSYRVIRTWTATDACGNRATATQVVNVVDKMAPEFVSIPPAITIGCDQLFPTTQPRASDACAAQVTITERTDRSRGACADSYTVLRIWTATDNCGNKSTASQLVTIEDRTAPVFAAVPPSVTIRCDAVAPDAEPTATDNCDTQVKITRRERREAGTCADSYTLVREWTAIDNCGNTATATQVITVIDPDGPVFTSVPPAVTVSCSDGLPTSKPTATDDCDSKVEILETQETLQGACPDSYVVIRVWIASDNCGHTARATQEVTVIDRQAPKFAKVPASRTIDCDEDPGETEPVATDDCDTEVAITMTETTAGESCATGKTLTRVWTATDNCGNTATASQVIRFEDREKPVISKLDRSLTVECDQPVPVVYPTATDNCDRDVEVIYVDKRSAQTCGATITRTWVATDDCGNTASATQLILIRDSQPPILSGVPTSTQITCGEPLPSVNVTVSDNCSQGLQVLYEELELPGRCAGERIVQRYWTATDACGNSVMGSQEVVISDSSAPQLAGIPESVELACGAALPTTLPTAADACGGGAPVVTVAERTEPGSCSSNYRVIRTFTAADKCGNLVTASQIVTFRDSAAPSLQKVPASVTITCGMTLPIATPTATDGCDKSPKVTLVERKVAGNCEDSYEVLRVWTATDHCGNTATASQTITVVDNVAPVFAGVPKTNSVTCAQPVPTGEPTAQDNCAGSVPVTLSETRTDVGGGYTLLRVWTASDRCGNVATASQLITVTAGGEPIFTYVPEDVALGCGDAIPNAEPRATDPCGGEVTVTLVEKRKAGKCDGSFEIIRTWTAQNADGKTVTARQTISVSDEVVPVFTKVPADIELACGAPIPTEIAEASDNCGLAVRIKVDEKRTSGECGAEARLIRTFTASDDCGNKATATQVVTYRDHEAPKFTFVPESEEFQCSVGQPKVRAQATDNCTPNVNITFTDVSSSADCSQRLQRIWTATDQCGNSVTAVQQILLADTERPSLVNVPGNVSVDLTKGEVIPVPAKVLANDGCDREPRVDLTEQRVAGVGCGYVLVRTWTAIDRCGNTARGTQRVSVSDGANVSIEVAPFGDCAPESIALSVKPNSAGSSYTWTSSAGSFSNATLATPNFLPNGAGRYTISVRVSGSGCTGTISKEIVIGGAALDVSSNSPLCTGGRLTLSASAGAREYRWTGPNGFTSTEQNPVLPSAQLSASGTYRLTANFGACQQNASVDVVVAAELRISLQVPAEVCGEAPFTLSVTDATTVTWIAPGGERFTGTTVTIPRATFAAHRGQWSVEASNAAGCKTSRSFVIHVVRPPVVTATAASPVCVGSSIELHAAGASNYIWTGPNGMTSTEADVSLTDAQAFPAGSYTYYLVGTNIAGCVNRDTVTVVLNPAGTIAVEVPTKVCEGQPISLLAQGGTSYLWTGPNGFTSNEGNVQISSASNAQAGTYTLLAGTKEGCTVSRTFDLAVVEDLVTDARVVAATCADGGSVTIQSMQGITYTWADLEGTNQSASRVGLTAGVYRLTARLGACERTYTYTVRDDCGAVGCVIPEQNDVQITAKNCGATDGNIRVTVDDPSAYTWVWTPNVSQSNVANGLDTGDYFIVITRISDSTCRRTLTAWLGEKPNFGVTVAVTPVSCQGGGSATILPSLAGTYSVRWKDLPGTTNELFRDNLAAGSYVVMLTDDSGCTRMETIVVGGSCGCEAKASVVRANKLEACLSGTGVEASLVKVTPGTVPAGFQEVFVLANAASGEILKSNSTGIFTLTVAGNYSLHQVIFDPTTLPANLLETGATIASLNAMLIQGGGQRCGALTTYGARVSATVCCPTPQLLGARTTDANCGEADGRADVQIGNSLAGDTFRWSPAVGNDATPDGRVRQGLPAGNYRVTVYRAGDTTCQANLDITIGAAGIKAGLPVIEAASCGQQNGRVKFPTADPALSFAWSDGGVGASRTNLSAGAYTVSISRTGTTCTETANVTITAVADFQVQNEVIRRPDCGASNGEVGLLVTGGTGQFDYTWGPAAQKAGLRAGVITVAITDRLTRCSLAYTFVLEEAAPGDATIRVADVVLDCYGATDGRPDLQVSYGPNFRLPPTVTIVTADGRPVSVGQLAAGSYCVLVKDAEGCLATSTCFAVTQPELLVTNVTARAAACQGTGALNLDVRGGTPPYAYDWAHLPAANDPRDVERLAPGAYTVVIRDARGCSVTLRDLIVADGCKNGGTPTPTDTLRLQVRVNSVDSLCIKPRPGYTTDGTTHLLENRLTTGSSAHGNWELRNGCLVYRAKSVVGKGLDLIHIETNNGKQGYGSLVIVDVLQATVLRDTIIRRVIGQGFNDSICLSELGLNLGGLATSVRNVCPPSGTMNRLNLTLTASTQCIRYTGLLPGQDSLCVQVCSATACDTFTFVGRVLSPKPSTEEFTLEVGQSGGFCLDTSELSSPITEVRNFCPDNSGGFVEFSVDELSKCITWNANAVGRARACYVICNAFGCDTTRLTVNVTPVQGTRAPVAVDDREMTTKNLPVVIDVLANDSLNGPLDRLQILQLPRRGNVFMTSDDKLRYTPETDFCGRVDSFSYVIGNGIAFDTAIVRIEVACDELVVFSGFSPNGDGVNDEFRILGIEDFPNNTLVIFNRWGNEVYRQAGYDNSADRVFTGRWNGKILPDGTYFYFLDLGDGKSTSGYLQISR